MYSLNENAFWLKMLKGIYFPSCNFLDATKGARASWAWNSLLEGRKVLNQNGMWAIGGGGDVRIFGKPWISDLPNGAIE